MGLLESGQNNQKTRDEIGQGSSVFPKIKMFNETISVEEGPTIIEHASITGSAIYGSPTFGIYGTSKYGSSSGGTFILGHTTYGILGTGELGSGSSTITFAVINPNRKFIERFGFDYFEDTSVTTATTDYVTDFQVSFDSNEVYQSTAIALNNNSYVNATITAEGETDNLIPMISFDGGTTWCESEFDVKTSAPLKMLPVSHYLFNGDLLDSGTNVNNGTVKVSAAGYYPFDGDANDESNNSNDGTVTGATLTTDHLGNQGHAYSFDGTSDYISIPDDNSLDTSGDYIISMWVYNEAGSVSWPTLINRNEQSGAEGYWWIYTNGTDESNINFFRLSFGMSGNSLVR